jgi:hypothetical protein
MKKSARHRLAILACVCNFCCLGSSFAEVCVTQSQMQPTERAALIDATQTLAFQVQANDSAGVQKATIDEFAKNFSAMARSISVTAPRLVGSTAEIEQVYILDATSNKAKADGSMPDGDFVCTLNKGSGEADFSIASLPPGRYGFSIVQFTGASPWMVSMLLRQDSAGKPWKLAGLYPKESLAAGHDGLWFWAQARAMASAKQGWVAYLYYQEAQQLLRPAIFVSSTHLESLRSEAAQAAPPELADELSPQTPLVIHASDGKQYRISSIAPDNSLRKDKLDVVVHLLLDPSVSDQAAANQVSHEAVLAFLLQHPELRTSFHGVWVIAEASGRPVATVELPMEEIR